MMDYMFVFGVYRDRVNYLILIWRHLGATYVKRAAPGPRIAIPEIDEPEFTDPEPADVHSPSADPQFAYPEASGHIAIPGEW